MRVPREPAHDAQREPAQPAASRHRAADRVLALQSAAGNRAVARLLAREPEAPTPTDAKGADTKPAAPSGPHIVLGDLGAIALESWSLSGPRGGGGHGAGRGREDSPPPQELTLMTKLGEHSSKLAAAAVRGTAMDGELVTGRMKIVFKGALVSSYSVSGSGKDQLESWTINVAAMEFVLPKQEGDSDKGGPDRGSYDLGTPTP
jgi:hypothetical protein